MIKRLSAVDKRRIEAENRETMLIQKEIIDKYGHEKVGECVDKWCPTCRFVLNQGQCCKGLIPIARDGEEGFCYLQNTPIENIIKL